MLSLFDRHPVSRRELLRIGALGLGGLSLPVLLTGRASAVEAHATGKSVILLFQRGGPCFRSKCRRCEIERSRPS